MKEVDSSMRVVAASDTVSTDVDGEQVLLNLETGMYHGMNTVGTDIFEMIEEPRSVADLTAEISEKYEIDEETARTDVREFLDSLLEAGLVEVNSRVPSA